MSRAAAFLAALVMLLFAPLCANASTERPTANQLAAVDLSASRALFATTNSTRIALGLPALNADARLDAVAAQLARQMVQQDYFGHTDPNGVTFEQRFRAAGIPFTIAAENIATAADAAQAQDALVHSPDHYCNIVDPNVRRLGTAAVAGRDGEIYFVQEFSD